jgi:hypothetical protein
MARPSIYDPAKVQRVLDLVANGSSVDAACKKVRLRPGTFGSWVSRDFHGLADRFFAAMRCKILIEVDRTIDLSDSVLGSTNTAEVFAAKNSCDTRRWIAARLLREYQSTEHVTVDHKHRTTVTIFLPRKNGTAAPLLEGEARPLLEDQSDD